MKPALRLTALVNLQKQCKAGLTGEGCLILLRNLCASPSGHLLNVAVGAGSMAQCPQFFLIQRVGFDRSGRPETRTDRAFHQLAPHAVPWGGSPVMASARAYLGRLAAQAGGVVLESPTVLPSLLVTPRPRKVTTKGGKRQSANLLKPCSSPRWGSDSFCSKVSKRTGGRLSRRETFAVRTGDTAGWPDAEDRESSKSPRRRLQLRALSQNLTESIPEGIQLIGCQPSG